MVNKAQGKGYEDERNYTNMRLVTFDIDNIHVMRQSQQKLLEGILESQFPFQVNSTHFSSDKDDLNNGLHQDTRLFGLAEACPVDYRMRNIHC